MGVSLSLSAWEPEVGGPAPSHDAARASALLRSGSAIIEIIEPGCRRQSLSPRFAFFVKLCNSREKNYSYRVWLPSRGNSMFLIITLGVCEGWGRQGSSYGTSFLGHLPRLIWGEILTWRQHLWCPWHGTGVTTSGCVLPQGSLASLAEQGPETGQPGVFVWEFQILVIWGLAKWTP